MMTQKLLRAAVTCLLIAAASSAAAADTYPTKPIRLVIGFSPGGYVDLGSRLIAVPLGNVLGQQVVVDNRSGAGGILAADIAAHSPPDGYTLTIGSVGTHAINQSLYRKLPYNVVRDFQPIARLSDAPNILAVNPSFPAKSVKELIALAKARPGQITYTSAGAGTSTHIAAVLFEDLGQVKLVHVPYKGGGPAMIDVLSGQVPVTFATAPRFLRIQKAAACAVLELPATSVQRCCRICRPSPKPDCPATK